ncbi:flagellar basal body-associated protein FliL [Vibrio methylphosphonaticus]|uniref:flagellar basal body-associated protein FliL n=1 Tax=Vibrio methylphosphonaticus TaxID=2946866 RepID=UPI002029D5C8|nr:flagellar basal body-associated protein FliL [Vibrio methylphosphonaticus]MCL9777331.1 flagellar basal body-associated protein FliL [Vibrio methylphosphonaticus]
MRKRYLTQFFLMLGLTVSMSSFAAEEPAPSLAYFTLEPELTTNFFTKGNRLGYVQVRIDVMVANSSDLVIIEHHQPLIRDAVVEHLGRQNADVIKSLSGREEIRHALVDKLNNLLLAETGKAVIADLLFTKYLYQ